MLPELLPYLRWADVADILLVSVVIYGVLHWLQRNAGRVSLFAAALVAATYVAAGAFGMYLTLKLLHGLLAVVLIGLMILFQDDLRRLLSRASAWQLLRRPDVSSAADDVDAVTQAAFSLASNRVGALLVLAGGESLAPHLAGGVALDGRISVPLLASLFDPHSAGHDGAVLIEDRLVRRFAVHLPLSRNRDQLGHLGTRHGAALGLSERSDALVLVVSEERGKVSIAEEGRLETVADAAELKDRVERFYARRTSRRQGRPKRWTPLANWKRKVAALALATLAWFTLAYQPDVVERTFIVPIEYRNLPAHLTLDGAEPSHAKVTLSGPESDFGMLDPGSLEVSLDLSGASSDHRDYPISAQDVHRPFRLKVAHIDPQVVHVRFEHPPGSAVTAG